VAPGQNLFPFDPTGYPTDTFDQQGYVWHCHILGHEDHEMMRQLPVIGMWKAGVSYPVGRVVAHQNVDYRARKAHTSAAGATPDTRFDIWERVNNNNGSWQPQIIYAVGDRVTQGERLFSALQLHQAAPGQDPPVNPTLWDELPTSACEQISEFCAGVPGSRAEACRALVPFGEAACRGGSADPALQTAEGLMSCLSVCKPVVHVSPCSGLCANPINITVPDGTTFKSGPLGTGEACYATTSELVAGTSKGFSTDRKLTVNGREMNFNADWRSPLPPQRNMGYCIQATPSSASPAASFSVK
jgi:hypothetical protein